MLLADLNTYVLNEATGLPRFKEKNTVMLIEVTIKQQKTS